MTDRVDLKEFVAGFVAEAEEHLRIAKARLMDIQQSLTRGQTHPRAVRDLFRALHTLKGLSAMVGVDPIESLAHAMESVLRAAESVGGRLTPAAFDPLLAGLRLIEDAVRSLAQGQTPRAPPPELLEQLARLDAAIPLTSAASLRRYEIAPELWQKLTVAEREELEVGAADGRAAFVVRFVPSPALAAAGKTITQLREAAARVGHVVKVFPVSVPRTVDAPGGLEFRVLLLCELETAKLAGELDLDESQIERLQRAVLDSGAAASSLADDSLHDPWRGRAVRVDVERLDDAFERLAALVVTRFRVERIVAAMAESGVDVRELRQVLAENARQMRDLRSAILRLRLVPVTEMLEPLPLVVRGLSAATAKPLELTLEQTTAELDKGVADRVFPALVHLIRNAVDHGIEPPDERRLLGKPETGNLRVECSERAGARLELRVSDDGRGIDAAEIARAAGRALPRSSSELLDLLATPGFSTKAETSRTSGRGMGVDIVRRVVVDELGGELVLETSPGIGTTFVLRVPLTVTIIDAFAFEVAAHRFVAPVSMVEEIVEIDRARVRFGPRATGQDAVGFLERRGRPLPLFELARVFRLGDAAATGPKALVVRREDQSVAFGVDRMLGRQEVVVRTLTDPLVRVPGISGSTDLGDGRPTLVLDLWALSRRASAALEVSP